MKIDFDKTLEVSSNKKEEVIFTIKQLCLELSLHPDNRSAASSGGGNIEYLCFLADKPSFITKNKNIVASGAGSIVFEDNLIKWDISLFDMSILKMRIAFDDAIQLAIKATNFISPILEDKLLNEDILRKYEVPNIEYMMGILYGEKEFQLNDTSFMGQLTFACGLASALTNIIDNKLFRDKKATYDIYEKIMLSFEAPIALFSTRKYIGVIKLANDNSDIYLDDLFRPICNVLFRDKRHT